MSLNDLFPSRFLKATDLQGREPVVTISKVDRVAMGRPDAQGRRELVPVVYFQGKEKGLKLNITLARAIAAIAGTEDIEHWPGIAIQLFATVDSFGGKSFSVVRVKAPGRPRLTVAAGGAR